MSVIFFYVCFLVVFFFFFQAEDGIRDRSPSRGLGDVYKRQGQDPGFLAVDAGDSGGARGSHWGFLPSGTFLAIGFLSGSGGLGVGRKPLLACGYVRVGGRHWAPFRVLPKHGLSAAEGDQREDVLLPGGVRAGGRQAAEPR